jgi:hypothetical protein
MFSLMLTCCALGAVVLSHQRCEKFMEEGLKESLKEIDGKLKEILILDELDGKMRRIKGNQFINASLGSEFNRIRNLSSLETFNEENEEKSIRMILPFHYSSYNTLVKYKDISFIPFERNSLISSNEILKTNEIKPNEIQIKEFLKKIKQNFNIPIERIDVLSCWFENRKDFSKTDQNGLINSIVILFHNISF